MFTTMEINIIITTIATIITATRTTTNATPRSHSLKLVRDPRN